MRLVENRIELNKNEKAFLDRLKQSEEGDLIELNVNWDETIFQTMLTEILYLKQYGKFMDYVCYQVTEESLNRINNFFDIADRMV